MNEVKNVIKYFDLYTLDFSHIDAFRTGLEKLEDSELKTKFLKATSAEAQKENREKNLSVRKMFEEQVFTQPDFDKGPGSKMLREAYDLVKTCCENADHLLDEFNGADPFEVQELVHVVLGITDKIRTSCSDADQISYSPECKKQYLELMKESEFLIANSCFEAVEPLHYEPAKLAAQFLELNPDVKTLTLGCGKNTNTYIAGCSFRRAEDHARPSFMIDLNSSVGPDLVVDMHNLDFWKVIPNEYFENIQDHTYGNFLFQKEETVREIFRTLKPGGFLLMDHVFEEKDREQLKNVGFVLDDATKKAQKPTGQENCSIQ